MSLRETPLHDWHAGNGGKMVEFGGWSMPIYYDSIVAEHQATRQEVGVFDISHMARLKFTGAAAAQVLDYLLTRRVTDMPPGLIRYGLVANDEGGVLDDVLVYHVAGGGAAETGGEHYLLVVNAGNRDKILHWIREQTDSLPAVTTGNWQLEDLTEQTAMIAVQGPRAVARMEPLIGGGLAELKYFRGRQSTVCGVPAWVSRTGYTGEDGCEVIVPAAAARQIWEEIVEQTGAAAVGLGARDTLRLEAAMPLYGHELSEEINPFQAGLAFAVNLDPGREFFGCRQLAKLRELDEQQLPASPVRVGLEMESRRVPRAHFGVFASDRQVGDVTSGTFSPSLQKPIAMAYVQKAYSAPGTALKIDIRGAAEEARVVPLPFYQRSRK